MAWDRKYEYICYPKPFIPHMRENERSGLFKTVFQDLANSVFRKNILAIFSKIREISPVSSFLYELVGRFAL